MTKEEIMKLDDKSLIEAIISKLGNRWDWIFADFTSFEIDKKFSLFLWLCWVAEEKVKEMGPKKWTEYGLELNDLLTGNILYYADLEVLAHAHPRDRARAILMTIGESHDRT